MNQASITAPGAALFLALAACSSNGGNRDVPAPDGEDGVVEAEGEPAGDIPPEDAAPDGPGCTSDEACGDGDPCNGREVCATDTGRCGPGPVAPAGEGCDDGNPLTTGDACDGSGLCRGTPPASCAALAAAAGTTHACAILAVAGVRCWGSNEKGQLGNGTQDPSTVPVDATGLVSGAAIPGGGVGHTCAVLEGGGVKCWGDNYYGQVGDGTNLWKFLPTDVVGLAGAAVGLSLGDEYSCALLAAGGASCWGDNRYGQLGDGTTTARTTPVAVQGLDEGASALAAGYSHTCAVMRAGGIRCWGDNASGQLGNGTLEESTTAVEVTGLAGPAADVAAGNGHTCALLRSGGVQCWGFNAGGQLGNGTTDDSLAPADVTGLAAGAKALAAGDFHTCVLLDGGSAACWGMNDSGQLGPEAPAPMSLTPTEVTGLPSGLVGVAAGGAFTCAVTGTGGMFCWGANDSGQLGNGSTTGGPTPTEVSGLCP